MFIVSATLVAKPTIRAFHVQQDPAVARPHPPPGFSMKALRPIAGVLLVGLQAACASANRASDDAGGMAFPPPPRDVMAIHTYWADEQPPCPVVPVAELSARTEN